MITVVACIIGGMILIAVAVAVWCVALAHQEDMAELEGERLAAAMGFWNLGPPEPAEPKLARCDCCGGRCETVSRCWYAGIETFACEECRGG